MSVFFTNGVRKKIAKLSFEKERNKVSKNLSKKYMIGHLYQQTASRNFKGNCTFHHLMHTYTIKMIFVLINKKRQKILI